MKIALIGYGKMGKAIEQIALDRGHDIIARFDADGIDPKVLKDADVAIEFSQPDAVFENLQQCMALQVPVVCGTTGWLEKQKEIELKCINADSAFLYASNFSIGVNIFFAVNRYLAEMMNTQSQYEVEIEEIHHTQKLDAPSGTAITLANDIIARLDRKVKWVKEESQNHDELGIFSIREDPAPGTHLVSYSSEIDTIDIVHTAHSRTGFASGAVMAAEWLAGKKGVFSMSDMLGF
ncbi:MAG: 4-hydroxy-tetrahydrodipicolinate reductase [Saprospiraceae bacterium]